MSPIHCWLLGLGVLFGQGETPIQATSDPAQLREMLLNRQHPASRNQAALLLVQSHAPEAEAIVRAGLKQTESEELFKALGVALRLSRDTRFLDELLAALANGPAPIRKSASDALSHLATPPFILRLQTLAQDARAAIEVRQAALWTLGRSGRKSAAVVLLDELSDNNEALRHTAGDALGELTGQHYETNLDSWRAWWLTHRDMTEESWLQERLHYQSSRARRLEEDLEFSKTQVLRLNQQLYARLPAADRLSHVQSLVTQDDPALRSLAVGWAAELLPAVDPIGQKALADTLLTLSSDGSQDVQRLAVLALGRCQDPRAFDRLRLLLGQGTGTGRAAAARALTQQAKSLSDGPSRQRQVVAHLQKALEDPALEVVIEAAEDLGTLGVPETGPILAALLRHPSESVRQTAAQALERMADVGVFEGLLAALDDSATPVRFSLVGAIGHAVGDAHALTAEQRARLLARLEKLLQRDTDPGVRSRAATVLGDCGPPSMLAVLWQRVLAGEDSRVQEKAWSAFVEIMARTGSLELLQVWENQLVEAKQGPRQVQLLTEVCVRWQKRDDTKPVMAPVMESLVQAHLKQGKWSATLPLLHELLARPTSDIELERRLGWLLTAGEQALKEDNRTEALRVTQEAQGHLPRSPRLAALFAQLDKQARQ